MQATVMPMLAIVGENIRGGPIIMTPGIIERIKLPLVSIHFDQVANKGLWRTVRPVRISIASFGLHFHFIPWSGRRSSDTWSACASASRERVGAGF